MAARVVAICYCRRHCRCTVVVGVALARCRSGLIDCATTVLTSKRDEEEMEIQL